MGRLCPLSGVAVPRETNPTELGEEVGEKLIVSRETAGPVFAGARV